MYQKVHTFRNELLQNIPIFEAIAEHCSMHEQTQYIVQKREDGEQKKDL